MRDMKLRLVLAAVKINVLFHMTWPKDSMKMQNV